MSAVDWLVEVFRYSASGCGSLINKIITAICLNNWRDEASEIHNGYASSIWGHIDDYTEKWPARNIRQKIAQNTLNNLMFHKKVYSAGFTHFTFHKFPWSCLFAHFRFSKRGQLTKYNQPCWWLLRNYRRQLLFIFCIILATNCTLILAIVSSSRNL